MPILTAEGSRWKPWMNILSLAHSCIQSFLLFKHLKVLIKLEHIYRKHIMLEDFFQSFNIFLKFQILCLFFLIFLSGLSEFREDCHCSFKKGVVTIHLERVSDSGMLFLNHRSNSALLPCDVSSRTSSPQGRHIWHTQGPTDRKFLQLLSLLHTDTKHEGLF